MLRVDSGWHIVDKFAKVFSHWVFSVKRTIQWCICMAFKIFVSTTHIGRQPNVHSMWNWLLFLAHERYNQRVKCVFMSQPNHAPYHSFIRGERSLNTWYNCLILMSYSQATNFPFLWLSAVRDACAPVHKATKGKTNLMQNHCTASKIRDTILVKANWMVDQERFARSGDKLSA